MVLAVSLRRRWSCREVDSICRIVESIEGVWLLVCSVFLALEIASTE